MSKRKLNPMSFREAGLHSVAARRAKGQCKGVQRVSIKGRGVIMQYVAIAEKALGKALPVGAVVHHIDRNRHNGANANLVICQDQAYHLLLHYRERIKLAGGDPNIHRLCSKCKRTKLPSEFYKRSNRPVGVQSCCKECFPRIYPQ